MRQYYDAVLVLIWISNKRENRSVTSQLSWQVQWSCRCTPFQAYTMILLVLISRPPAMRAFFYTIFYLSCIQLTYSMQRYNCLIDDHKQPNISPHHLDLLAQLFIRHNAQNTFGVHLIHGHFKIPCGTIMLGSTFKRELSGYWTRPIPCETVLTNSIHGHIYALSPDNRLLAYEYREGCVPKSIGKIDTAFFHELSKYLISNKLVGLLGLEVLEDTSSPQTQMLEFVLAGRGTVMIKEEKAMHTNTYRVTGWSFTQDKDGTVAVKGFETHASNPSGGHQVFTDGKPLRNIDAVMNLLLQEGIMSEGRSWRGMSDMNEILACSM